MPYKSEEIQIYKTKHDRRVKLTDQEKLDIKELYESGGVSQRELAKDYAVSKRLIQFCIYPEKLEANKARRKERGGWKQYYDKDKNTAAVRDTRNYKQGLYVNGVIELVKDKDDE